MKKVAPDLHAKFDEINRESEEMADGKANRVPLLVFEGCQPKDGILSDSVRVVSPEDSDYEKHYQEANAQVDMGAPPPYATQDLIDERNRASKGANLGSLNPDDYPPLNPDANIYNADWTKMTWDLGDNPDYVLGLVFGPVKTREAQQEALYHFMDTPAGHNMPQEMREEIMMKGWRLYPKRIGGATDDDAI